MRFHIFHNWTKWTVIKEGRMVRSTTKVVVGSILIQERKCTVCGFVQRKVEEKYFGE
jgi:hypothetical protein